MRLMTCSLAAVCLCFFGYAASGQEKLKSIESKLRSPTEAAPIPAANASTPGYLGFLPDESAATRDGVVVQEVTKGAPSEIAGLRAGDTITAVDDKPSKTVDAFDALMSKTRPGQKVKLTVLRGGKVENLTVTLGRRPIEATAAADADPPAPASDPATAPDTSLPPPTRPGPALAPAADPAEPAESNIRSDRVRGSAITNPDPAGNDPAPAPEPPALAPDSDPLAAPGAATEEPAADPLRSPRPPGLAPEADPLAPERDDAGGTFPAERTGRASLGIVVLPPTEQTRARYGVPARPGALISEVRAGSAADRAGLPVGALVIGIDGKPLKDADDLVSAIRAGRPGQEVELTYYQGAQVRRKTVRLAPAAATAAIPADSGVTPGPGLRLPGGGDRPILRRVEEAVEGLRRPGGVSTTVDPSEIAEHGRRIELLLEKLEAIEARLQLIEEKLSNEPPAGNTGRPAAEPPGTDVPALGERSAPSAP